MASNDRNNQVAGALTYRNRNEEEPLPGQPRQPSDLQSLLRFAVDASTVAGLPRRSSAAAAAPMSAERRRFLEDALRSLTVDVPKLLQKSIKVLTNTELIKGVQFDQPVPDDIMAAFNNIMEFVDNIDNANDFERLGGFEVFRIFYESENEELRICASKMLAEVCQNNPHCQARVLESGLLNVLLNLSNSEKGVALVKCISAISSATRGYDPGCRELIAQGGCDILANALAMPNFAARTKTAFLIRYLCQNYPEAKEKFMQRDILKTIADLLKSGWDVSSEHLLSVLQSFVESGDSSVLRQCCSPTLNLKATISEFLTNSELNNDLIEEKEYCQAILRALENEPQVEIENSEIDR